MQEICNRLYADESLLISKYGNNLYEIDNNINNTLANIFKKRYPNCSRKIKAIVFNLIVGEIVFGVLWLIVSIIWKLFFIVFHFNFLRQNKHNYFN